VPAGIAGPAALWMAGVALAAGSPRHVSGPPPGHTGGFGEPTCQACHTGLPLNDPSSTLEVRGLDGTYRPGHTYAVTIRVDGDIYTRRAGFQAAFRWAAGEARGTSAGALRAPGPELRVVSDSSGRVRYVAHTEAGVDAPDGHREWTFEWTAPEPAGAISFHVAANAANGDHSPLDDLVYTASAELRPATGSR